jgi:hypothetical protein
MVITASIVLYTFVIYPPTIRPFFDLVGLQARQNLYKHGLSSTAKC